jgi:hypothetical protein
LNASSASLAGSLRDAPCNPLFATGTQAIDTVGLALGDVLGDALGDADALGVALGEVLGPALGKELGLALGEELGEALGVALGVVLGEELGVALGEVLGDALGLALGEVLGDALGNELGLLLGDKLRLGESEGDGLTPKIWEIPALNWPSPSTILWPRQSRLYHPLPCLQQIPSPQLSIIVKL